MNAINSNKAIAYYCLSQLIIQSCEGYANIALKAGKEAADDLLTQVLLVFHRQVKHGKTELKYKNGLILTAKDDRELLSHLSELLSITYQTNPLNPSYPKASEFSSALVNGRGFQKILNFKGLIFNTLNSCGCSEPDDREEILNESLITFWKKLGCGEIGLYFTGNDINLENCKVFNYRFYQNSKLSTFLAGIAKNIFFNRTRTSAFQLSLNSTAEITEESSSEQEPESPALFLFLYYRQYLEERKLRTIISILQYDCNLEDKEVRQLLGINNARIHSSRLRAGFAEWYEQNIRRTHEILDNAHEYLVLRESKKEQLNEKIRTIDLYNRSSLPYLNLGIFKEEFRSIPEFRQNRNIFNTMFYFASTGKPSALAGLPDEKPLRDLLEIFKTALFSLKQLKAIHLLLFYGSDEPRQAVLQLFSHLLVELNHSNGENREGYELVKQLTESGNMDEEWLSNDLYSTNRILFSKFSDIKDFMNILQANETA
ncbi:MAG: hypothetical protein HXX13_07710 [Bacteroidetes bacterium]|nr:hypothetical protein [Bacteroidota bacterium]